MIEEEVLPKNYWKDKYPKQEVCSSFEEHILPKKGEHHFQDVLDTQLKEDMI